MKNQSRLQFIPGWTCWLGNPNSRRSPLSLCALQPLQDFILWPWYHSEGYKGRGGWPGATDWKQVSLWHKLLTNGLFAPNPRIECSITASFLQREQRIKWDSLPTASADARDNCSKPTCQAQILFHMQDFPTTAGITLFNLRQLRWEVRPSLPMVS